MICGSKLAHRDYQDCKMTVLNVNSVITVLVLIQIMLVWEILDPEYGVRLHVRHIEDPTPETKMAVSQKIFYQ